MNEINNIKRNSFFSFLSIASRLIPNVFIFWFLARFFGPTTFGKFSYSLTLANTFLLFADFGFDLLITTEIATNRSKAKEIFQQYFWIKICLAILSLIFMITFIIVRGGDYESIVLGLLFSLYMLFNTITNFFVASFKGFEKLDYDAKVSILMNLFLFFVSVIIFSLFNNIFLVALAYAISRILGFVYSIKLANSLIKGLLYKIVLSEIKQNMKKAFLYGVLILASSLLFQLDTILLGLYKSNYEVGIYQSVKNLLLVPFIVPGVVFSALLPTLARMYKEDFNNYLYMNNIFFKIIFLLNLLVSVILFIYPEQIIEIIYSAKNYSAAIPLLKIFSVILFLRSTSDYFGVMLITSEKQKFHVYSSFLGIGFCIIFSATLIPKYGAFGASLVYLLVISLIFIIYLIFNRKILFKYILSTNYYLILALSILIGIWGKDIITANVFLGIPLLTAFYLFLSVAFFFSKKELKSIFAIDYLLDFRKNQ